MVWKKQSLKLTVKLRCVTVIHVDVIITKNDDKSRDDKKDSDLGCRIQDLILSRKGGE